MDLHDDTLIPTQKSPPPLADQQKLQQILDKLALQSLRSSEKILTSQTYQSLAKKFTEINQKITIAHFLEEFVYTLINYANKLKHELKINISKQDYEVLEQSVQKSEAEIRKHIKIQQQLKLYLDGLEEKIQQLQYKLELQDEKYMLLFENFKQLDQSHKKLTQQLSQSSEAKRTVGQQYQFKSIQMASNENMMSRKTKLGLKSRLIMEKLQERTRKTNERKRTQMLSITEDEVNLQADPHLLLKKRNSIDRYKKQGQNSIKQLSKSLQMKHQKSLESYHKKMLKNKTEANQKQGRSSSIIS